MLCFSRSLMINLSSRATIKVVLQSHLASSHHRFHLTRCLASSNNEARFKMLDASGEDLSQIPEELKKPGGAIWRFKNFFNLRNEIKPSISFDKAPAGFACTIRFSMPSEVLFRGTANKKKTAEAVAMAKALVFLRQQGRVDHKFMPVYSTVNERREFVKKTRSPVEVTAIPYEIKQEMFNLTEVYDSLVKEAINRVRSELEMEPRELDYSISEEDEMFVGPSGDQQMAVEQVDSHSNCINVISSRPYQEPDFYRLMRRDEELREHLSRRMQRKTSDEPFERMRNKLEELPIFKHRQQIVETIKNSRVTVIAGDTGCGKSTQVPQYIFEEEIIQQLGPICNMVVTQPRRISAISIAERVAYEFGEDNVGRSIGYQVRLQNEWPKKEHGVILFCSAGILLRKFQSNPHLKGLSHVIIDEVHERDVITDFLLVLLKRAMASNPDLRIILMSASMNAHLFSEFFNHCPVLEIPARCHPVTNHYLDRFQKILPVKPVLNNLSPKIDKYNVAALIIKIAQTKAEGAILCFLPGWKEIQAVHEELQSHSSSDTPLLVVPIHSKLPYSMQKEIFRRPPAGIRKVVLATNIAETSLTIDDVVYVVDPGLCNEMRYKNNMNICTFGTHWISKANARQRAGRAGRVMPGHCYRLYTENHMNTQMEDYPVPELLRIPLEKAVMEVKVHCPNEKVADFLSKVPQPPTEEALLNAIKTLKLIQVLDENENLTPLGKRIVSFAMHPRLSVAVANAAMLGCLVPVLTIATQLSVVREPFLVMPDQRAQIRQIKKEFCCDYLSDHLALFNLTNEYENACWGQRGEANSFCNKHSLHEPSMKTVLETRRMYVENLFSSDLIPNQNIWDLDVDYNKNWANKDLIIACLLAGFYPNVLRLLGGELRGEKINKRIKPYDVANWGKVKGTAESLLQENINADQNPGLVNALATYFGSFYSQEARMISIRDVSVVTPLNFLIFSRRMPLCQKEKVEDGDVIVTIDENLYLKFKMKTEDGFLIYRWSEILDNLTRWFMLTTGKSHCIEDDKLIADFLNKFVKITTELLKIR